VRIRNGRQIARITATITVDQKKSLKDAMAKVLQEVATPPLGIVMGVGLKANRN